MTDKQIIIHGVDVSRCKKYKHEIERCNTLLKNLCFGSALDCTHEKSKNCYYKQLKRKEQEHKETQKALAKCWIENGRLKKECEELKEINSTLLEYRRHAVTCQDCYEDGLEDGKTSNKELRKLKQTLEEIKEIVCRLLIGGVRQEILQKINECEVENAR